MSDSYFTLLKYKISIVSFKLFRIKYLSEIIKAIIFACHIVIDFDWMLFPEVHLNSIGFIKKIIHSKGFRQF